MDWISETIDSVQIIYIYNIFHNYEYDITYIINYFNAHVSISFKSNFWKKCFKKLNNNAGAN